MPKKATPARPPRPKPSGLGDWPKGLVPPPALAPISRSMGPRAWASREMEPARKAKAEAARRTRVLVIRSSSPDGRELQARKSAGSPAEARVVVPARYADAACAP